MSTHEEVTDSRAPRGQGKLFISAEAKAVLEGAKQKAKVTDFTEAGVKKCTARGWIQFEGEDGETLGLTQTGRDVCERLGVK